MSDNIFGFSFSDSYFYNSNKKWDKQQLEDQEFIQLQYEQQNDKKSDCINEDNEYKIKDSAKFPNWDTFERMLKKHKLEVGFKFIKFRLECDNKGDILRQYFVCKNSKEYQPKKKTIDADHRERDSKKHCWKDLLIQYTASKDYLNQLWKTQQSWAKIYMLTTFCAGIQSTQWVESTNGLIKAELSKYKNVLPTKGLSSIQSVFFKPVQDAIKEYLILKSASVQNIQISQSILYHTSLFEISYNLTLLLNAHEYMDGYLEDEYDALQASLENIINMVSHNAKFDIKLISKHWYTDSMQASNYSVIPDTSYMEYDTNEEINQVISIHEPDIYRASIHNNITQKQDYAYGFGIAKSELKFALENVLVNEFVGLITRFIENHTGVDTNKRMTVDITQIENPKKLKYKGHPKLPKPVQQSNIQNLNTGCKRIAEIDTEDEYVEESSS
ncbi:24060_t:CDS:2 [Dentiscutata erythropus]|uniref:24060_t:CDS:1 n=1 Tax=Dentiscutata erythropus TaxID=1348616 RepID=A0A9N9AUW7_9GLOM|nr:24060_t:CDS:2 [Dentiscutata erythropus]